MRRRRAFPGFGPDVDAKYERSAQWLLAAIWERAEARVWCKANNVPVYRAAGEIINSAGGYLVPADLAKAILDIRETYGAFRRSARLVPMASDSTSVARRPGGTGAFFMAENTTSTETQVNVDAVDLTAKKIGALIRMSTEVEQDAQADMVDFVSSEIAWAFALKEDDCAFNGDGTSTYGGMRGISTIALDGLHAQAKVLSGHNTFIAVDQVDLANLMSAVRASAIPNARWYCSQMAFAQTFCRLCAADGGGAMETREIDGVMTPVFLGFPVILTQKMPLVANTATNQAMIVFGDMYQGAVLGERRAITLAKSPERYIHEDQIAVLGTERFHTVIHDMGDNVNQGSIAVLVSP